MKRIEVFQQEEFEQAKNRESALQKRERQVLVSALQGELAENKNRIEAFVSIYNDMLQTLKAGDETPQYQQAGDILQRHPSLSKAVFEANVGKFSLLDIKLAGKLSKFYISLPKDQEYINIERNVPIDTVIKLLEKTIKDAEDIMPQLQHYIDALQKAEV